jgi:hypothetical protein
MNENEKSSGAAQQPIQSGRTPTRLRWSLAAGFIAFGVDLGFSYVLRQHVCSSSQKFELHLVTIACLAMALLGFELGWTGFHNLPHDAEEEGGEPHDRAHFEALLGMGFSLAFALGIIALAVPRWILTVCE